MRAAAADGLIPLPPEVNAMSTAPASGSRSGHDWLIVGTAGAAPVTPPGSRPRRGGCGRAPQGAAGTLRERTAEILHGWRAASEKAAAMLRRAGRERSVPSALAPLARTLGHTLDRHLGRPLLRIGRRLRASRDWQRASHVALLRTHPVAATLGSVLLLALGYVAYCVATIPSDGGLVIEPTPSALVVEADGGQVFATRGVFKGDKLAPQMCRPSSRKPSSPSKTVTSTSTPAFICHR